MENSLRILLIEDNPGYARLILDAFAEMDTGFELIWADSLSKGLEQLVPDSPRIDAILLDLSLPDSQGLNSFSQVHAKVPQVPVIVLTGTNDDKIALEMMRAGAQDYLVKGETDSRLLVKTIHYAIERIKVAQALDESERTLSTVMSRTPGVVFRCKNDPDWTIEYVSDGMRDICGYAADEFIHNHFRSFISIVEPEDRAFVTAEIEKTLDTRQPYVIEYRTNTATGDRRWVAERGSATFSDDNELILREGLLIDVTRRRKAEEELKQDDEKLRALLEKSAEANEELEERVRQRTAELTEANEALRKSESTLRSVFSASPVGIHIISMERKIQWMNDRMTAITDYRLEDIEDRNPRVFYLTEEEFARVGTLVFEKVLQGNSAEIETQWARKDGQIRNIHLSVAPIDPSDASAGQVSAVTDITEQKEAEKRLLESEERFRTAIERSNDGVTIVQDNKHIYVNQKFLKMFGYDKPDEIIGKPPRITIHPDDRTIGLAHVHRRQRGEVESVEYTFKGIKKDGSMIHVEVSGAIMYFRGEMATVGFFRDITERKRAEEALKESGERFRALVEKSGEIISLTNTRRERIYVSPSVKSILGYSVEEYRALKWSDVCHPDEFRMLEKNRTWMMEHPGETLNFVSRLRHKDGSWRWMESAARNLLDNPSVRAIVVNYHDITERKNAEEALKANEERFRTLVEKSSDVLQLINSDHKRIYVSPAVTNVLGYSPEEFLAQSPEDATPPEDRAVIETAHSRAATSPRESVTLINRRKHKDGSWRWTENTYRNFYDDPNVGALVVNFHDITDRKNAEDALRLDEARLESLVKISQQNVDNVQELLDIALEEAINLTESKIGYIYYYNEQKEEFTLNTWSRDVMKECNIANPQGLYNLEKTGIWGEAVRQRKPVLLNDYQAPHYMKKGYPEGHAPLYRYLTIPIFVENRIVGVIGVANKETDYNQSDIRQLTLLMDAVWRMAERKRTEEVLREAKEAAEAATRAKSNFLANMSHEIRTPMNAIIGLSRLALNNNPSAKQQDYLNKIQSSAHILLRIINDILDLSKIEAGKLEIDNTIFNLDQLIQNVSIITTVKAQEKGLALSFHRDPDVPLLVTGDPLRLNQVLVNLIGNAVKFTGKGEIVVDIKRTEKEETGQTFLEFSIRDTGIGMTPKQTSIIFSPFTQADESMTRKYGGTGLGLAISKQLVEQMGGTITVVSTAGIGSTFTFTVLLEPEEDEIQQIGQYPVSPKTLKVTANGNSEEDRSIPAKVQGARILIVEDNEINQQVAREILENDGFIVELASNGFEAIERVADTAVPLDALLMDIQMPEMDGFEATRTIREKLQNVTLPIIAMTAHVMESDRQNCFQAGMNDYIPKPIDPEQCIATIARWIAPRAETPAAADKNERHRPAIRHDLPHSLPGVNMKSALKRMSGNKHLLIKLLLVFADNYTEAAGNIRKALADGNNNLAQRLTHNLKGISGNLSADSVFTASKNLEAALKKGSKGKSIDTNLTKLEKALETVIKAIKSLPPENAAQEEPAGLQDDTLPAPEKIAPILLEIHRLLNKNSLTARKKFITLKNQFNGKGQGALIMEHLEDALNRMDFKSARKHLVSVAKLLEIELQ